MRVAEGKRIEEVQKLDGVKWIIKAVVEPKKKPSFNSAPVPVPLVPPQIPRPLPPYIKPEEPKPEPEAPEAVEEKAETPEEETIPVDDDSDEGVQDQREASPEALMAAFPGTDDDDDSEEIGGAIEEGLRRSSIDREPAVYNEDTLTQIAHGATHDPKSESEAETLSDVDLVFSDDGFSEGEGGMIDLTEAVKEDLDRDPNMPPIEARLVEDSGGIIHSDDESVELVYSSLDPPPPRARPPAPAPIPNPQSGLVIEEDDITKKGRSNATLIFIGLFLLTWAAIA